MQYPISKKLNYKQSKYYPNNIGRNVKQQNE